MFNEEFYKYIDYLLDGKHRLKCRFVGCAYFTLYILMFLKQDYDITPALHIFGG